jgi:hypothetical protein
LFSFAFHPLVVSVNVSLKATPVEGCTASTGAPLGRAATGTATVVLEAPMESEADSEKL